MQASLKVSPFFSIYRNGNKYIAYAEASGLIELSEDEFNNLLSLDVKELKEIRMLIPEKEKKINAVVNGIRLLNQEAISFFESDKELPKGENALIISSSMNFLLTTDLSKFEKVLIAYVMDPYRFFIYVMKKNSPCIYEIYLWLKNSRLILDVKVDGAIVREGSPTLSEFTEFLLLGLAKILLNGNSYDGKLIYIDMMDGELIVNTPLKIPGCPKCKI
ncbi:hypothetical protein [Acidianus brierleyi]|uniref:Uncharacterized protein n=1 Tax=Acidianus brierleyi TaxID=41673 RepID=A0A2U9IGH6_9CREN|nr:hypothetical protein [Acidianus brierleyi]AWR95133.1 hypothetical protein DFR85_11530 [Acidianus brierleyi]